jgi:hypothetical protein
MCTRLLSVARLRMTSVLSRHSQGRLYFGPIVTRGQSDFWKPSHGRELSILQNIRISFPFLMTARLG